MSLSSSTISSSSSSSSSSTTFDERVAVVGDFLHNIDLHMAEAVQEDVQRQIFESVGTELPAFNRRVKGLVKLEFLNLLSSMIASKNELAREYSPREMVRLHLVVLIVLCSSV